VSVALVARDLIIGSRVLAAVGEQGEFHRCDDPTQLPPVARVSLVLVDWAERRPGWGEALMSWSAAASPAGRPRIILFGPHTDLLAHADARAAGLGPMWARSRLIRELPALLAG